FVPEEHVAEALAAALPPVAGRRILLPQAAAARPVLAEQLAARGAAVEAIPIYDTEPVALDEASLGELARGVDAIVFTSGSTVRSFVASVRGHEDAARQVAAARVVCIGLVTAEAAQAEGLPVAAVANEASVNGVVEALLALFGSVFWSGKTLLLSTPAVVRRPSSVAPPQRRRQPRSPTLPVRAGCVARQRCAQWCARRNWRRMTLSTRSLSPTGATYASRSTRCRASSSCPSTSWRKRRRAF
ncbi:MAG: uroporphyrinogen-III synthase, partial [Caldilineaceae bacterium]|nr:uroporphyrinogen-III synthase [Caldilineaceae bacterium]